MGRRSAGIALFALAAVLFLSRYVFALWYRGIHGSVWSREDFAHRLGYVGTTPWTVAVICVLAGLYYLYRAEVDGP